MRNSRSKVALEAHGLQVSSMDPPNNCRMGVRHPVTFDSVATSTTVCGVIAGSVQLLALLLVLLMTCTVAVQAQRFTVLKSYGSLSNVTGVYPASQLVQGADGTLYGTTQDGEGDLRGVLFKMQPDGSGFAAVKFFRDDTENPVAQSPGNLILDGSTLYGTAGDGTANRFETVFKINTDGTQFSVLRTFNPSLVGRLTSLLLSGSTVYGTTEGTTTGGGTVFRMNVNGTGYSVLMNFGGSGGRIPLGAMAISGSTLYGITSGAVGSGGALFRLNTDGSGFTVLRHSLEPNPSGPLLLGGDTLYGLCSTLQNPGYPYPPYYIRSVFQVKTDGTDFGVIRSADGSESIILDGSTLYGTRIDGRETVFRIKTDGTGYQTILDFGSDGIRPGGLLFSGGKLYGVTSGGGSSKAGTAFKMNPDGTGYTELKNFGFSDAQSPQGLTLAGNILYGTTLAGGNLVKGTLFKLNTNGTGYNVVAEFDSLYGYANSVLVEGPTVYGTTRYGGHYHRGTIYRANANGTGFDVLKHLPFEASYPYGRLVLGGSTLYGTTWSGGPSQRGTVYKINVDGTAFTLLKGFDGTNGGYPKAGLILSGTALYGTASNTVFRLNTDGSGYTVLKRFFASEGVNLDTPMLLKGDTLYGMTYSSGAGGPILFKINTDGTGYRVIRSFPGGANSISELTMSGGTLFGAVGGILFQINPDGTGYFVLKIFTPSEGWGPTGGLAHDGQALYGASRGGEIGSGMLFRLDLPTPSIAAPSFSGGAFRFIVSGPAAQDYAVQAATNPASGGWSTILRTNSPPMPFSFTDPSASTTPVRFYRAVTGSPLP